MAAGGGGPARRPRHGGRRPAPSAPRRAALLPLAAAGGDRARRRHGSGRDRRPGRAHARRDARGGGAQGRRDRADRRPRRLGRGDPHLGAAGPAVSARTSPVRRGLRRPGDRASAAQRLDRAAGIAARLGAAPLARRISERARRAGLSGPAGGPLTARESEVVRLLARGRSNREIAEELVISPKTASVHVSNIIAKLGVASRGEAAAAARDRGLA
ncbi:LuxR C-terminal-related transcriptional regulator [Actinomadura montaniterrae]|uniref:LuxR C-terminal-related transcriptional regulator n=1 Tax=Actinomadura montaniterrae TaxID=1803903 RepID=UPI00178C7EA3|nr:LuxR C-terminal-related transcriptional regulator [Actinomadura montaniterrae]